MFSKHAREFVSSSILPDSTNLWGNLSPVYYYSNLFEFTKFHSNPSEYRKKSFLIGEPNGHSKPIQVHETFLIPLIH